MTKEIYKNIWMSEIPLHRTPLKAINNYVIKDEKKALIIDTGFNHSLSKDAFFNNLSNLDIDIAQSEVIITHLHSDHSGLAAELYQLGAKLYFSGIDGKIAKEMGQDSRWKELEEMMFQFGFPKDANSFDTNPAKEYSTKSDFEYTVLKEGDKIIFGNFELEVVSVPGHTPDMINLYDRKHKLYFSADHVLDEITPNIGYWGKKYTVILNQYFSSLKKIYDFDIEVMLPSHRGIISNHKKRIDELLEHHEERLEEVITILEEKNKKMTVVEVAMNMNWRIRAKSWDEFPQPQKWFASGEAMSHLEYLSYKNKINYETENDIFYFSKK